MRSNHDINFISSNIKTLAFIYYIINYATKYYCNQYQHIIDIVLIQNAHNKAMQQHKAKDRVNQLYTVELDIFSLRAFNHLVYNHEISGPLAASITLGPPEFYTPKKSLKKINMTVF